MIELLKWLPSKDKTNLPSFDLYLGSFGLPRYFDGFFDQSFIATKKDFHVLSRILSVP